MPEINETPSINNEIEILANATFGEEVRQAIIDALTKCYTDVIAVVLSGVKKGDSVSSATINSDGELIITILDNETQETTTFNCGNVVGSDGSDGAGIQSIRLDTTVGSSTYGHLFIQIQGQSETDIGYIIGPKGDPGETAPEHEWNVDGSFSQSSVNPVQNKVITAKLNEIMTDKLNKTDVDSVLSTTRTNPVQNKVITSALNGKLNKSSVDDTFSQSSTNPVQNNVITAKLNEIIAGKIDKVSISSNHVLASNGSGGVKDSTKLIGNSNYFHSGSDYLALESAVKQYTYSKSESDNKYVQISQIDDELDEESENPVQNKVVAEKFAEFEENYSAPEAALDITSTNAVQNKVIAEALNGKVNVSDFNNTIFDDIDLVFSNTNGGIYYGGDCPSAPALFIEAEGGVPEYPSGYAYYLSYVDSLYDSDDNPHWHRIANISNLITRVIPVDNELSEFSKNPVQNKVIKAALDGKIEYMDESYGPQSLDDINHFTDPNKIYHFYLGLNNINEMVDLIFIINDDEADWDNEVYPYSCQFMLSQSGKIYYRKTNDQGIFGSVKDFNPIDNTLSTTSENPVQNKVIKAAIDEVVSHGVIIDDSLSTTSENPVQNKVIAMNLTTKESKSNKDNSLSELTSDTYDRTHYPSIKCLKTVQNAIPTVPTNVSSFTNDAGYLTQHQSLSNYYTKSEIDSDLNGYQTKIDNSHKLSSDLVDDTNATNQFVTSSDKTTWNNKLSSANGAVKSSNIDNGAVTTEKLASSSVTLAKLHSGVIDNSLSTQGAAAEAAVTGAAINGMKSDVEDIKAYLGYDDEHIVGLQADFRNKTFKRLAGAYGLNAGTDFDAFPMFGGRRRCNVAADGTINAYYGDEGYTEDGTNGQVMVYQPAFYYKVVPLELEKNTVSGIGNHLRKANYYVSSKPVFGFKRHPLFYDEQGNPVDYVLLSAYEGSMYDVSEEAYVNDSVDTTVAYGAGDLLCSVAGKKPISGKLSGVGTKANFETMANNIGSGWHLNTIKAESANQLLMLIELGRFNTQAAIGLGVVSCPNNGSYNCSSYTGSTASLGNATGMATETTYESAGTETVNTTNGKLSVTYRGVENPWGNIWKHTNGINFWGDGHMGGGQVFICDDFSFNESKHDGNYQSAGFTISNGNDYVSAFGYGDEEFDWLFMPSETTGNSSLPVGDNYWCQSNLNGYRIALFGGSWNGGGYAGGFYWVCYNAPSYRNYGVGGRLLFVPTATV